MVSSRHFPALKGVVVVVPLSRGPLEASSTMAAPIKNRRKKSGPAVRPTLITLSVKCLLIPRNLGKRESKVLFFHLLLLLLFSPRWSSGPSYLGAGSYPDPSTEPRWCRQAAFMETKGKRVDLKVKRAY